MEDYENFDAMYDAARKIVERWEESGEDDPPAVDNAGREELPSGTDEGARREP